MCPPYFQKRGPDGLTMEMAHMIYQDADDIKVLDIRESKESRSGSANNFSDTTCFNLRSRRSFALEVVFSIQFLYRSWCRMRILPGSSGIFGGGGSSRDLLRVGDL